MMLLMLWKCVLAADVSGVMTLGLTLENMQHLFIEIVLLQLLLICFLLFLFYVCLLFLRCLTRMLAKYQLPELRTPLQNGVKPVVVGFFHPYCNAGGGGERVLWCAIRALQSRYDNIRCVIYTGDTEVTREEILRKAQERFKITLPRTEPLDLTFIHLYNRKLVEASTFPRLTLLGQSLGSMLLGFEAMFRFIPDIYIDSMGYAFTFPLFKYLAGCKVACYVHYPTISSDMLERVSNRVGSHNNAPYISQSVVLSKIKIWYYKMFAMIYGFVGRFSDVVAVNSTWTLAHIVDIWRIPAMVIYPPCNVDEFLKLPMHNISSPSTKYIVSLSQFRPEKNHQLQLHSFKAFLTGYPGMTQYSKYKLLFVGSCRNDDDISRVNLLKELVRELELEEDVEFRLDVTFEELKNILSEASVGIHTMWNEHFGIGIVEFMAAGSMVLAHNSGGPKYDIVVEYQGDKTGFLASDEDSYAECLSEIFSMPNEQSMQIRRNARLSVQKFSDSQFEKNFLNLMQPLFN